MLEKDKTDLKKLEQRMHEEKDSKSKTDLKMQQMRKEKEYALDQKEHDSFQDRLKDSMEKAMTHYCKCLYRSNAFDRQALDPLISLWFSSVERCSPEFLVQFYKEIDKVPSHTFLPLIVQIGSRLSMPVRSTSSSGTKCSVDLFKDALLKLTLRIAIQHPHHVLFQIFALKNANELNPNSRYYSKRFFTNPDRVDATKEIIKHLATTKHKSLIDAMTRLIKAYVEVSHTKWARNKIEPNENPLRKVDQKYLQLVAVPTRSLAVMPDGKYDEEAVVTLSEFKLESVCFANTGITRPIIVEALGFDGVEYKQLIKPEDDLRQDAVMQQLFVRVNSLLEDDAETRSRRLQIRTYNVVPLTPMVGLVEWALGTSSLSDLLVGGCGVHTKYAHKNQKGYSYWSKELKRCHDHIGDRPYPEVFKKAWDDMQPCFHRYFLDQYQDPKQWFQRRLAYTRSVAVNSMVGYIVGLGDRHNHNILLDKQSGEVVHIDLGVAFDAGKTLKTPEIVPFRLTRDLVDAMGITGVEGVFRRCSEETLRVLRANRDVLVTILEVFVHDPLYKWSLSPAKKAQLRRSAVTSVDYDDSAVSLRDGSNTGAKRAIRYVKQRLAGLVCEHMEELNVEGQVTYLQNEAINYDNLSKMYFGWASFLDHEAI